MELKGYRSALHLCSLNSQKFKVSHGPTLIRNVPCIGAGQVETIAVVALLLLLLYDDCLIIVVILVFSTVFLSRVLSFEVMI